MSTRALADDLAAIVGSRHVRVAVAERVTYAMDGLPTHRRLPDVVVLPGTREEVIAVIRLLAALGIPSVPRGAGTKKPPSVSSLPIFASSFPTSKNTRATG